MKKLSRVFIAVYTAVLIALLGFLGMCFGSCIGRGNSDIYHLEFELENVPEGTVFVDILAKGNWEKQRRADVDNEHLLGIDRNCEIVRYDKDGYKSLMFNTEIFMRETRSTLRNLIIICAMEAMEWKYSKTFHM